LTFTPKSDLEDEGQGQKSYTFLDQDKIIFKWSTNLYPRLKNKIFLHFYKFSPPPIFGKFHIFFKIVCSQYPQKISAKFGESRAGSSLNH